MEEYDYGSEDDDSQIGGRWTGIDSKADSFPSWSPYVYALDNPVRFNDKDGRVVGDPIKDAIEAGKKSPTFNALLTKTGITGENYKKSISLGTETATFSNGHVTIENGLSTNETLMGLTHELTNLTNLNSFKALDKNVASGKISADEYASGVVNTEAQGFTNKVLVAFDLGLKDLKSSGD